jgi:hypothetical protein
MVTKIRMPLGTRMRSGLKEPARGKKGLEPRPLAPAVKKRQESSSARQKEGCRGSVPYGGLGS